jgi:hypothetical protein
MSDSNKPTSLDDEFLELHRRPDDFTIKQVKELLSRTDEHSRSGYMIRIYFNNISTDLFGRGMIYNRGRKIHMETHGYYYANLLMIDHVDSTILTPYDSVNGMFRTLNGCCGDFKYNYHAHVFIEELRKGLKSNIDRLIVESVAVYKNIGPIKEDIITSIVQDMSVDELIYMLGTRPGLTLYGRILTALDIDKYYDKDKLIEYIRMTPVIKIGIMLYNVFRGAGTLV